MSGGIVIDSRVIAHARFVAGFAPGMRVAAPDPRWLIVIPVA
jgi:hypothetical protein